MELEELKERLEYNPETGIVSWKVAPKFHPRLLGQEAGNERNRYRTVKMNGKAMFVHKIAWALHHNILTDKSIDHINGNTLDNRISNLREVTHGENMRNKKLYSLNKSKRTGVSETKDGFIAYITKDGNRIHLGSFGTLKEASAARIAAEKILDFHENHGRKGSR